VPYRVGNPSGPVAKEGEDLKRASLISSLDRGTDDGSRER